MDWQLPATSEGDVPELYVDSVRVGVGLYGFILEMGIQGMPNEAGSEEPPIKTLARVRMSPQHALILSRILRKNVAAYQTNVGPIVVPRELLEKLGLPEGD